MSDANVPILPYRTDVDDLRRFVAAQARGRTPSQIRALGFSAKSFEGTANAAEELGLVEDRNGDISALGRRLALAEVGQLAAVVRAVVLGYPPYSLLIENVLMGGGPAPTPLEWMETWWATHGFGTSESNRAEAAPVFARLLEAAGFGSFVQGRKGHPSRIEWFPAAAALLGLPSAGAEADVDPWLPPDSSLPSWDIAAAELAPAPAPATPTRPAAAVSETLPANHLRWQLSPGRQVRLATPADLSAAEKRKILQLLQLLLED